jgi:hypothetical protein
MLAACMHRTMHHACWLAAGCMVLLQLPARSAAG